MNNDLNISALSTFYSGLRKTFIRTYGSSLLPLQKKKLENLDFSRDILVISASEPVKIDESNNKIYVSKDYFTAELKQQLKFSNPELTEATLRKMMENESVITQEGLIAYSEELKYTTEDLIKSISISEILRYIIDKRSAGVSQEILYEGVIQYCASVLGAQSDIYATIPKESIASFELVRSLTDEKRKDIITLVIHGKMDEVVEKVNIVPEYKQMLDKVREEKNELYATTELNDLEKAIEDTAEIKLEEKPDQMATMIENNELSGLEIDTLNGKHYLKYSEDGNVKFKEMDPVELKGVYDSTEKPLDSAKVFDSVGVQEENFIPLGDVDRSALSKNQEVALERAQVNLNISGVNVDNGNVKILKEDGNISASNVDYYNGSISIQEAGVGNINSAGVASTSTSTITQTNNVITDNEAIYLEGKYKDGRISEEEMAKLNQYYNSHGEELKVFPPQKELKPNGFASTLFGALVVGISIGIGVASALLMLFVL